MSLLIPKQIGSTLTVYGSSILGSSNSSAFASLFANCPVINAIDLNLPTNTTLNCYYRMFYNTPLAYAPMLKASAVEGGAYNEMFYNCSCLRAIYTLQTSWFPEPSFMTQSKEACTRDWVKGVPGGSDHLFHKVSALDVSYGNSRIPWDSHTGGWSIKILI